MEVLANAREVILLQYINVLNQHVVHLMLTQCTCQVYVQKAGKNGKIILKG